MGKTLFAAGAAVVCVLFGLSAANAVPAAGPDLAGAANAASALQPADYTARRTRHGVVKCYRTLVVGPYRCHYYHRHPL